MIRLIPAVLLLLAACHSPIYPAEQDANDTCTALGHTGAAHAQCVARRLRAEECRKFVNSSEYTAAEARRRDCQPD